MATKNGEEVNLTDEINNLEELDEPCTYERIYLLLLGRGVGFNEDELTSALKNLVYDRVLELAFINTIAPYASFAFAVKKAE